MRVYVIRHGHAIPHHGPFDDEARWLHEDGRAALARVAGLLRDEGVAFDAVVSSPLVRAVQTAEIIAAGIGYRGALEALPELAPDGSPRHAAEVLLERGASVAAVGHEPSISSLASHLAGIRISAFRPGQVACIDDGALAWMLDPVALTIAR